MTRWTMLNIIKEENKDKEKYDPCLDHVKVTRKCRGGQCNNKGEQRSIRRIQIG